MIVDLATRATHPRLAVLAAVGLVVLAVGVVAALADPFLAASTGLAGLRVAFVGFLLATFGVSGYVAVGVFETHPEH